MDFLSVMPTSTKAKAAEDARQMELSVIEECQKIGQEVPGYTLLELIGKGSFGRVYKGKQKRTGDMVAVKIINIDDSDNANPRLADTFADIMKEIAALKVLSETKAKNINLVIDALPVGKSMWMVTEYCAGGSISTLMRPTPKGLQERFIVIILREVAEAIEWVHKAGIIHRDLKCANVLITEDGRVQLCDFGVAGMIEHTQDKRTTFIGTPNWMAPEMFETQTSYGKEVDIWAYGSMAFEMATGLPPNATVHPEQMGDHLKEHIPRLEGDQHSAGLRDLVAYCLEENPRLRPTITQVRHHHYIHNTEIQYPTSLLVELMKAFKHWEAAGGARKSLFMPGGAQGPTSAAFDGTNVGDDDEWNFSTTEAFNKTVDATTSDADVLNVYGENVAIGPMEQTVVPSQQRRRRPPPGALSAIKAPIEKIFDPHTISNYDENSRVHYLRDMPAPMEKPRSDLPLRARSDTSKDATRESMIDLGDLGDYDAGGSGDFGDFQLTLRPGNAPSMVQPRMYDDSDDQYDDGYNNYDEYGDDFSGPSNPNRKTQEWTFASAAPAAPAPRRLPTMAEDSRPPFKLGGNRRPSLIHAATEPAGGGFDDFVRPASPHMPPSSDSRESLIDLDFGMPDETPLASSFSMGGQFSGFDNGYNMPEQSALGESFAFKDVPNFDYTPDLSRPSTANSMATSGYGDPFSLEREATIMQPQTVQHSREPSLYLTDEDASRHMRQLSYVSDVANDSDIASSTEKGKMAHKKNVSEKGSMSEREKMLAETVAKVEKLRAQLAGGWDGQWAGTDIAEMLEPVLQRIKEASAGGSAHGGRLSASARAGRRMPGLIPPPSESVMIGTASKEELARELTRMMGGMADQLEGMAAVMRANPPKKGASQRKSRRK